MELKVPPAIVWLLCAVGMRIASGVAGRLSLSIPAPLSAGLITLCVISGLVIARMSLDAFRVGDRLHVIPNHVCPAVNLSDVLYGYRDGRGVREIPVIARGKYR